MKKKQYKEQLRNRDEQINNLIFSMQFERDLRKQKQDELSQARLEIQLLKLRAGFLEFSEKTKPVEGEFYRLQTRLGKNN